jgi:hypothetical protein
MAFDARSRQDQTRRYFAFSATQRLVVYSWQEAAYCKLNTKLPRRRIEAFFAVTILYQLYFEVHYVTQ